MLRKRNTPTLLVGFQAGTTTLENNLDVSQRTGNHPSSSLHVLLLISVYHDIFIYPSIYHLSCYIYIKCIMSHIFLLKYVIK